MKNEGYLELIKARDFGQIIEDTFKFVIQNFSKLFKLYLVYALPPFLIGSIAFAYFGTNALKFVNPFVADNMILVDPEGGLKAAVILIFAAFTTVIASALIYVATISYMWSYERGDGEADMEEVNQRIRSKLLGVVAIYIFIFLGFMFAGVLFGVMILIPILGIMLFLCFLIGVVVFYQYWSLAPVNYILEDVDILSTFKKSFKLVKGSWWWYLAITIIIFIMIFVVQYIFQAPFLIYVNLPSIASKIAIAGSTANIIAMTLYSIGQAGVLLLIFFTATFRGLSYYKFIEEKEGLGTEKRIEDIGSSEDKYFGNEGEF